MLRAEQYHGVLPVNKPADCTSHDVVSKVRYLSRQRSVGHTGTLDPAATGLLALCMGRATKLARYLTEHDKKYTAVIRLGWTSTTYDAEGADLTQPQADIPSDINWLSVCEKFTGVIKQRVPAFSAIRVDGTRLYEKSRRGEEVELPERDITIHELTATPIDADRVELDVHCSSGTYIRSLAHDIGQYLGCGAFIENLCRTRIGRLSLDSALAVDGLERETAGDEIANHLIPVDELLDFTKLTIRDEFRPRLSNGCRPTSQDVVGATAEFAIGDRLSIQDTAGHLLAVGCALMSSMNMDTGAAQPLCSYDRVLI